MRALILLVLPALALAYNNNKMLCLVNKQRQHHGLSALGMDDHLTDAAQHHSNDQARMHAMSHSGSDGSDPGRRIDGAGYGWQKCAENVAFGYRTEKQVMKKWMKSPGHRANILGPYTHFGSAVAFDRKRTPYYTQDFGNNHDGGNFPLCPDGDTDSDDDEKSESSDDDHHGRGKEGDNGMQVQVDMPHRHRQEDSQQQTQEEEQPHQRNNNMDTNTHTDTVEDTDEVEVPIVIFGGHKRHRHHRKHHRHHGRH